jgi:membrane-associated phospholipid phosphatase
MNILLEAIRSADISIYHYLNGFAGNGFLDYMASFEENANLLKGGLFLAVYWYFWVSSGAGQDKRRKAIVAILIGAVLALAASRTIADLAPYRVRPMFDLTLQHHPYSFPISHNMVNWSAFPSDTATFFFALAFGLAYLSRRFTIPAMVYVAGWICLPRMFLGLHYASDIVAGGIIGTTLVWIALKVRWLQASLATRVVNLADARPAIFYVLAFLVSFEMGVLFDDVRLAARSVFQIVHLAPAGEFTHALPATFAVVGILAIACLVLRRFKDHLAFSKIHLR